MKNKQFMLKNLISLGLVLMCFASSSCEKENNNTFTQVYQFGEIVKWQKVEPTYSQSDLYLSEARIRFLDFEGDRSELFNTVFNGVKQSISTHIIQLNPDDEPCKAMLRLGRHIDKYITDVLEYDVEIIYMVGKSPSITGDTCPVVEGEVVYTRDGG